jgi:hypothetical protein
LACGLVSRERRAARVNVLVVNKINSSNTTFGRCSPTLVHVQPTAGDRHCVRQQLRRARLVTRERGSPTHSHTLLCESKSLTLVRGCVGLSSLHLWYCGVVMSGEDAPRPYLENLIVLEIKTNKQTVPPGVYAQHDLGCWCGIA